MYFFMYEIYIKQNYWSKYQKVLTKQLASIETIHKS